MFTNTAGGPIYADYANQRFRKLLALAGLPRISLRELRHTGAPLLLSTGAPLEVVQEQLGHTSILTTRRYARVLEESKRKAANRLGAWLEAR